MTHVLETVRDVSAAAKLVALAIANYADALGLAAYPGQQRLAAEALASVRNLRRLLVALEDAHVVHRYRRGTADGTGRSSDGYVLRSMHPDVPVEVLERASRLAEIHPDRGHALLAEAVDNPAQPANLAGSPEGSTGHLEHLNRPNRAAQPATGGRQTVLTRPDPSKTSSSRDVVHSRQQEEGAETLELPAAAQRLVMAADEITLARIGRLVGEVAAAGWTTTTVADALDLTGADGPGLLVVKLRDLAGRRPPSRLARLRADAARRLTPDALADLELAASSAGITADGTYDPAAAAAALERALEQTITQENHA